MGGGEVSKSLYVYATSGFVTFKPNVCVCVCLCEQELPPDEVAELEPFARLPNCRNYLIMIPNRGEVEAQVRRYSWWVESGTQRVD